MDRSRRHSDESYVVDLCDELLGVHGLRQHRFPWLLGDPGRGGRRSRLPVDAFYPERELVIEYRERQHDEPVAFFDGRETVSGASRGVQRRLYDEPRELEIARNGLRLVIVRPSDLEATRRGKLVRARDKDLAALKSILID